MTDFLLQPREDRTLTVQVVDAKGKAVANGFIGTWFSQRTDKSGRATVPFPATYYITDGRKNEEVFPIWAANSDLSAFGTVTPKPTDKSVRIVVSPGVPVNGQVVDEKGRPVAHARVCLQILQHEGILPGKTTEMSRDWFEVNADAHGRFRCFVPADQPFTLLASAPNFFPTQTKRLVAQRGKPIQVRIKMLRPDTTFEWFVVDDETGKPIAGAAVIVYHWGEWGWFSEGDYATQFTFTDFNGRFHLTGIRKDHVDTVRISHPLYSEFRIFRAQMLPQGHIALERIRPSIAVELEQGKPAPLLSDVRWLDEKHPSLQGKTTYLLFATPYEPNCEQVLQRLKQMQEQQQGKVRVVVVFDASLPLVEAKRQTRTPVALDSTERESCC